MSQYFEVLINNPLDPRAQHFYDNVAAVRQAGSMHLRHRCSRQRIGIELGKAVIQRSSQRVFDPLNCFFGGECRHLILQ